MVKSVKSVRAKSKDGFTFLSLFCGAGGLDYGFHGRSFRCKGAFDSSKLAVDVYNKNYGSCAQVFDLSQPFNDLQSTDKVDVVIAGPPCQGFSNAGKREFNDPRNTLLFRAGYIAVGLQAKAIVIENVKGVVSRDLRRHWDDLVGMLLENDYCVTQQLVNASDLGIPQNRLRMLLIAFKRPTQLTLEFPRNANKTPLSHVLDNVPSDEDHQPSYLTPGTKEYLISNRIGHGQKLCNVRGGSRSVATWEIPDAFGPVTNRERVFLETVRTLRRKIRIRPGGDADPVSLVVLQSAFGSSTERVIEILVRKGFLRRVSEGHVDLSHTFNGKFRRLDPALPSHTVDTRFISPRYFLHPYEQRGFTIREAARIQSFPDDFSLLGSRMSRCKLIGDAVPPGMSIWLANQIAHYLQHQ
jgi:DNA (cytosine-5)-methyltransferase 1